MAGNFLWFGFVLFVDLLPTKTLLLITFMAFAALLGYDYLMGHLESFVQECIYQGVY